MLQQNVLFFFFVIGLGQARTHSRPRCCQTRRLGWWNGWRMGTSSNWQSWLQRRMETKADRQSKLQGKFLYKLVVLKLCFVQPKMAVILFIVIWKFYFV